LVSGAAREVKETQRGRLCLGWQKSQQYLHWRPVVEMHDCFSEIQQQPGLSTPFGRRLIPLEVTNSCE
jgi:hypothetical protein